MIIGEYSAQKNNFFPGWRKNCEKIYPYFSISVVENCKKLHLLGKNLSRLALFWGKIVKISTFWGINYKNLGLRIEKNMEKGIKICTFWGQNCPPLISPLLIFGRILPYDVLPKFASSLP